jgi:hypothetical protein
MTIRLTAYLGHDITELLNAEPFVGWHAVRTVETDSKHEVWYEFDGHGVEVICDLLNSIKSIPSQNDSSVTPPTSETSSSNCCTCAMLHRRLARCS